MSKIRVRFAPSPTGALHIGGVRTALYNYLFAKKEGGTFILRIEDTDQTRYVPGAEKYIMEALEWAGLKLDEGPGIGGEHGPYRQSERKALYGEYAKKLVDSGHAYYAFDTPEDLAKAREEHPNFKYGIMTRSVMKNSLTMSAEEVQQKLDAGEPSVIRLKVPADEAILINDIVRGEVTFQSNELDDKVMLKGDGMPTYHLANIVDDHLMEISHVIRGEEWLTSTAHHVLLYRAFGWEDTMPKFSHLPLILKPTGKGKLSKRDGAKLGIPVFPLSWDGGTPENTFDGFREFGFLPEAMLNFLAFLGWNPGTEQEIFTKEELAAVFDLEKVGKSGAKFDYDKAKWFNQQYIMGKDDDALVEMVTPIIKEHHGEVDADFLKGFVGLMKERATLLPDFWTAGSYFFKDVEEFDLKSIRKRWKPENSPKMKAFIGAINGLENFDATSIETAIHAFMEKEELGMGVVMPALRLALTGTMKGPSVFDMMSLLGKQRVVERLEKGFQYFDDYKASLDQA